MHLITSNTISSTVLKAYEKILGEGEVQTSRNGNCTALYDVTLEITDPRSRHLSLIGRKSNIFQMIAETFWVMAGDNRISPYLDYFLPRAKNYSDDGLTWHGGYGQRLYQYGQLESVIDTFKEDGLHTRRAYISIQMPEHDAPTRIIEQYGEGHKAKDVPCNQLIQFYCIGKKFHTKLIQRSGDVLFGAGSINPFEFTFLHELMFNEVSKHYPELELGSYKWHVTNLHLYQEFEKQAFDAILTDINRMESPVWTNDMQLIAPPVDQWKDFFSEIVEVYSDVIVSDVDRKVKSLTSHLGLIFYDFDVPKEGNLLWHYCQVITSYIAAKKEVNVPDLDINGCDWEFVKSIQESPFRKFELVFEEEI